VASNNSVILPITSTLQDMDFTFIQSTDISNYIQYQITNTIPKYNFGFTVPADPVDPLELSPVLGWTEKIKSLYHFDTELTGKVALGNVSASYPELAGYTPVNNGKTFDRMQALVLNFQLERIIE